MDNRCAAPSVARLTGNSGFFLPDGWESQSSLRRHLETIRPPVELGACTSGALLLHVSTQVLSREGTG